MRLITACAATALVALATQTGAETYNVDGTGTGTAMTEAMPVHDGLVVIKANTMYDGFEGDNPDNPLASVTGPCFGDVLIDMGQVSGDGLCHYTDADGDQVVIRWVATGLTADGRTTGDWSVLGGSGKWMEASGGGTFNAGSDAAGAYSNMVTGEVTLP